MPAGITFFALTSCTFRTAIRRKTNTYIQAQAAVAKLLRERGAVSIARALAAAVNDKVRLYALTSSPPRP